MIANALLHDETVLFGSKNTRAVDVVIERLSRTLSEPILLSYGNQPDVFADALLAALERALVQDDLTLDIEINDYEVQISWIQRDENEARDALTRIVDRRNRIQQLETLAKSLTSELPLAISSGLKLYDPPIVDASLREQLLSMEQLAEDARRPNIITRIRSFFGQPLDEQLTQAAQSLLEAMPDSCLSLPVGSRNECMEVLAVARTLARWADHQSELSTNVTQNWNEPRIEILRARIANSQERSLAVNLKRMNAPHEAPPQASRSRPTPRRRRLRESASSLAQRLHRRRPPAANTEGKRKGLQKRSHTSVSRHSGHEPICSPAPFH